MLSRGAFCISIDLERAWGVWDHPTEPFLDRCLQLEDEVLERLIGLFEKYGVVATWAVVGQLLERRQRYPVAFDERVWYAPRLVERIQRVAPQQEIASHSFGHIYYDRVSIDEARRDCARARALHDTRGLDLVSFVYPRNEVAHTQALVENGIRVYRSVDYGWHTRARRRFGKYAGRLSNLVDKLVPITPPTVRPIRHGDGLVELPSSMLLIGRNGLRRFVSGRVIERKARAGLRRAATRREVFHLWFHPSNFYYRTTTQFNTLERILTAAVELRTRGELDIVPMSAFASS